MNEVATLPGASVLETLPQRLWVVLAGLRHAIAAWGGRDRAAVPLVVLVWGRVGRLAQRFEALVARLVAGTLPPPRVRVRVRAAAPPASVRLPGGFGWLGQALPEARAFGSQLQVLLEQPEMVALVASCPRALRILRPLRRMLGIAEPGAPVRAPRAQAKPRVVWWQAPPPPVCPGPPDGPVLFPPGRPPPGWSC